LRVNAGVVLPHADKLTIVACDRNLFAGFRGYFGAGPPVHTMGTGVY
jgi:hypothetical protein